jgi:hypothetical protein
MPAFKTTGQRFYLKIRSEIKRHRYAVISEETDIILRQIAGQFAADKPTVLRHLFRPMSQNPRYPSLKQCLKGCLLYLDMLFQPTSNILFQPSRQVKYMRKSIYRKHRINQVSVHIRVNPYADNIPQKTSGFYLKAQKMCR